MRSLIERHFPKLVEAGYVQTSPMDSSYNCIAFTLGDQDRWWWPPVYGKGLVSYWPPGAPVQETVEAFAEMYALYEFETCPSLEAEDGYVKVAIFAEAKEGLPAHAALQLPGGRWISKMWDQEDIAHTLEGLEGPPHYFRVSRVLKCRMAKAPAGLRKLLGRYGVFVP